MDGLSSLWKSKRVLIVGDECRDRWEYGTVHRVAPEAPVPVIVRERSCEAHGMAGLVGKMVGALGCYFTVHASGQFATKTRIMARSPGREYQTICRIDDERPMTAAVAQALTDQILFGLTEETFDVILLSDYAKGVCTKQLCVGLQSFATARHVRMLVDPGRGKNWGEYYYGTIIKANEHEWSESGFTDMLHCVGALGLHGLIVTRGDRGMTVATPDGCVLTLAGRGVEGLDPTGCGDQAFAMLGVATAAGLPLAVAARMANICARMQVQRHRCQPVTLAEFEKELLELGGMDAIGIDAGSLGHDWRAPIQAA